MFPPPDQVVEFFLAAYGAGAFPMAEPQRPGSDRRRARARRIDWYIPDPRAVIDLTAQPRSPGDIAGFHIPRSLARRLRNHVFSITADAAFERVIRACAEPAPGRETTWLDERLIHAYTALHGAGHAHSVEVWAARDGGAPDLVGGVYGVMTGSVFSAESMFCRPDRGGTDASKIALVSLVRHLHARGFTLVDVQIKNRHTERFGVVEVPSAVFMNRLRRGLETTAAWGQFPPITPPGPAIVVRGAGVAAATA